MTDTITAKPAPSIDYMVRALCELMGEAEGLPRPVCIDVYGDTQHVSLHFESDPSSQDDLAQWTARFGGTIIYRPVSFDGQPSMICRVDQFPTLAANYGLSVDAFAIYPRAEGDSPDA